MNKLVGSLLMAMTAIAVLYCNYCAVKETVPFFKRIIKGTKTKVSHAGGRVVHMFKRSEDTA